MPEPAEPQVTPESTPAPESKPSPEPAKPAEKPTLFRGFDDVPEPEKKDDPKPEPKAKEPKVRTIKDTKPPKDAKAPDTHDPTKTPESPGIKQLREGHERSQKEWKEKEADYQKKLSEYESKLKELSSRPERHPDDQKKLSEYEKKVAAADFKNSEEYEKKFRQPLNKTYQDSLNLAKRLPAFDKGEDGDTQRASTEADFRAVLQAAQNTPERVAELAHQLYGPVNAARVITMVDRISDLYDRGEQEAIRRAEEYQTSLKEQSQKELERTKQFSENLTKTRRDIEAKMPDIFGDHEDDPDAQKLLNEGRGYVDEFRANRENMTDAELVEREAVIEAAASAFPVMKHKLDAALAKAKELEEELAKFRQSDPGSGGKRTPPDPKPDGEGKGLGALTEDWKKFDRR